MFEIIGTLMSGVLSGGATGLLGILVQRFFDKKAKDQDISVIQLNQANAIALKQIEMEQMQKQIDGNIAVAQEARAGIEAQAEAQEQSAAASEFAASVESDKAQYLTGVAQASNPWAVFMMGMVDWVRGMTRPLLTLYLVTITHLMFNWVRELAAKNGEVMAAADLKLIIMTIVQTILYLATVAVVWWFGTRPPKAPAPSK